MIYINGYREVCFGGIEIEKGKSFTFIVEPLISFDNLTKLHKMICEVWDCYMTNLHEDGEYSERFEITIHSLNCVEELFVVGNLYHMTNEYPDMTRTMLQSCNTAQEMFDWLKDKQNQQTFAALRSGHVSAYGIRPERLSFKEMKQQFDSGFKRGEYTFLFGNGRSYVQHLAWAV